MKDNIVKLPCEIGTKIYKVFLEEIVEYVVCQFIIYSNEIDMCCTPLSKKFLVQARFATTEIGYTVFFNKEEAERKLNK